MRTGAIGAGPCRAGGATAYSRPGNRAAVDPCVFNLRFTVNAESASVYKAPTNVSPVIGEAKQGATLEVTRDVGGWVKVAWSKAPDGVGYIRKSAGTMGTLGPAVAAAPAAKAAPGPVLRSASAPAAAPAPQATSAQAGPAVRPQPAGIPTRYVTPTHRFGVGGQVGGAAVGAGFSARGWTSSQKFGIQIDVTHHSMANDVFFTRMSWSGASHRAARRTSATTTRRER